MQQLAAEASHHCLELVNAISNMCKVVQLGFAQLRIHVYEQTVVLFHNLPQLLTGTRARRLRPNNV